MKQKHLDALRLKALMRGDLDTAEHYRTLMERDTIVSVARDVLLFILIVGGIAGAVAFLGGF